MELGNLEAATRRVRSRDAPHRDQPEAGPPAGAGSRGGLRGVSRNAAPGAGLAGTLRLRRRAVRRRWRRLPPGTAHSRIPPRRAAVSRLRARAQIPAPRGPVVEVAQPLSQANVAAEAIRRVCP